MAKAKEGSNVKVHYTGKLDDGSVFDSSKGRNPLQFTLGEGQVIPGFEQAVDGMDIGETKTVTIPMEQAYGPHQDELVIEIHRSQLPPDLEPQVGDQLQMQHPSGQIMILNVIETSEETITVDANHPLAGKDLTFYIELVEVEE